MLVLPFSDIAAEIVEDSPFATSDNLFNEEKIFIKREWSEIRLKTYNYQLHIDAVLLIVFHPDSSKPHIFP